MDDQAQAPAEYPKMLYKGGEPYGDGGKLVPHQDSVTVANAEEEADAVAEGYGPYTPPGPLEEVEEPAGEETTAGEQTEGGESPEGGEPTSGADTLAGEPGGDTVAG